MPAPGVDCDVVTKAPSGDDYGLEGWQRCATRCDSTCGCVRTNGNERLRHVLVAASTGAVGARRCHHRKQSRAALPSRAVASIAAATPARNLALPDLAARAFAESAAATAPLRPDLDQAPIRPPGST
jgi:hypothetical protein